MLNKNYAGSIVIRKTAKLLALVAVLMSGCGAADQLPVEQTQASLSLTPEDGTVERIPSAFITQVYVGALGRYPTSKERTDWTNYFTNNGCSLSSLQAMALWIYNSSSYNDRHLSNADKVRSLYRGLFGREPDPTGFAYWKGKLDAGTSISDVIKSMTATLEFQRVVASVC